MARRRKPRVTNPEFLQYANLEQDFAIANPTHHEVAWLLVVNFFPGIDWRCGYTPDKVWQELKTHQPTFPAVLDGLIAQELTPAQEATIRLHVSHYGPHPRFDRSPPQSYVNPGQGVDIEVYGEVFEPHDPLDPLYYQLHMFLLSRHVQDLRRCPACGRYFYALTAGLKRYCRDSCRGKQTPAEANRKAVRKWRAVETEKDLAEVRAAVRKVRGAGRQLLIERRQVPQRAGPETRRAWLAHRPGRHPPCAPMAPARLLPLAKLRPPPCEAVRLQRARHGPLRQAPVASAALRRAHRMNAPHECEQVCVRL